MPARSSGGVRSGASVIFFKLFLDVFQTAFVLRPFEGFYALRVHLACPALF